MKYSENNLYKEAALLFSYITSAFPQKIKMPHRYPAHYEKAVQENAVTSLLHPVVFRYHALLGPADAISSVFAKRSLLQKKLFIASALFECSVVSANVLLPKKRSYINLIAVVFSGISFFCIKFFMGIFCHMIPGFFELYAKK